MWQQMKDLRHQIYFEKLLKDANNEFVREAFNQYLRTVFREEPLDPTLPDYEGALSR